MAGPSCLEPAALEPRELTPPRRMLLESAHFDRRRRSNRLCVATHCSARGLRHVSAITRADEELSMSSWPSLDRLCPRCHAAAGLARSVSVAAKQRTVDYRCPTCEHVWAVTTSDPGIEPAGGAQSKDHRLFSDEPSQSL